MNRITRLSEDEDVRLANLVLDAAINGELVTRGEFEQTQGVLQHVWHQLSVTRAKLRDVRRVLEET